MEAVVETPVAARTTESLVLESSYLPFEETSLEDRDPEGALVGGQAGGQTGEGSAGAAGEGHDVGPAAQFRAEVLAAAYGEGVAAPSGTT